MVGLQIQIISLKTEDEAPLTGRDFDPRRGVLAASLGAPQLFEVRVAATP